MNTEKPHSSTCASDGIILRGILHREFTPFTNIFLPASFTDPAFAQCSIDRPPGASPQGRMILVNHFLDTNISGILIPNRAAANVTNSAASITTQANICVGLYGSNPNFILVGNSGTQAASLRVVLPLPSEASADIMCVCIQLDWMSVGDGMLVQATMNGVPFIPSTTVSGTPGNAASSPAGDSTGTATGSGSATQTAAPGRTSSSQGDSRSTPSVQVAAMFACAVLALGAGA